MIASELGKPPEELYATFDRERARGSLDGAGAPCHARMTARTSPSRCSDPNIVATVKADLGVLQDVSNVVENVSGYGAGPGSGWHPRRIQRWRRLRELDYHNEAYHARRLADNWSSLPMVHVPTVYPDLSGDARIDDGIRSRGAGGQTWCAGPGRASIATS